MSFHSQPSRGSLWVTQFKTQTHNDHLDVHYSRKNSSDLATNCISKVNSWFLPNLVLPPKFYICYHYSPSSSDVKTCLLLTSHSIRLQNSNFVSETLLAFIHPFHSCGLPPGVQIFPTSSLDPDWPPHLCPFLPRSIPTAARLSFWKHGFTSTSFPAPTPSMASCRINAKVPLPPTILILFLQVLLKCSRLQAESIFCCPEDKIHPPLPPCCCRNATPDVQMTTYPSRALANATSSMKPF